GVRYWWTGLGLTVLVLLYVVPVAAAFRVPATPPSSTPLPALSIPAVGFPQLRVPSVRRLAPLPPLAHQTAAAPRTSAAQKTGTGRHVVRRRVPVVSDTHSQGPPSSSTQKKQKDAFAAAPVVDDTIGLPVQLPAAASSPAPSDTTANDQPSTPA